MSKNEIILEAVDVYKSYKMGPEQVKVLKGVTLSVKKGELAAIVGSSGSGKSTLLHILGGLDKADKGEVIFEDRKVNSFTTGQLNKYRNKNIGFVFQFYHLLEELDVLENIYLPAMVSKSVIGWLKDRKKAKNRALELLNELGLGERARHKPSQLSGGERQRVAIGRALMNEPDILLADEPTGNLDSNTGNGILNIFERLNSAGQTILMVTHDEKIAKRCKRIITLTDGKIL